MWIGRGAWKRWGVCRARSTTLCNGIGKRYLCCRSKWGMPMTGTNGFAIVQTLGPLSCPFPPVCNFTSSNEVKRYRRQGAGGGGRQGRPTTSKVNTTQTISDSCTAQAHFCADSLPLSPTPSQQIRNHHLHFALSPVLSNSYKVKFYLYSSKSKWVRDPD